MLAALTAVMAFLSPVFFSVSNFLNIVLSTSVFGVLAIGMTFVICSAGIDLSVGSIVGFSGVVGALTTANLGLPWPACIVGCLAAGAFAGWVNGFLVTRAEIPPFIATLGMLGVARGTALVLSNGVSIYGLPPEVVYLGQGRPFGVPTPVFVLLRHRRGRPRASDPHPLRRLRAGDRRQRGGGARHGRARRAAQGDALCALRPALRPRWSVVRCAHQFGRADRRPQL